MILDIPRLPTGLAIPIVTHTLRFLNFLNTGEYYFCLGRKTFEEIL